MGCGDGKGCGPGGTDYVCAEHRKLWLIFMDRVNRCGVTPELHQMSKEEGSAVEHLQTCQNSVCKLYYAPSVEKIFPPKPSTT